MITAAPAGSRALAQAISGKQRFHDTGAYIGKAMVPALKRKRQLFVLEAEQMQQGRV